MERNRVLRGELGAQVGGERQKQVNMVPGGGVSRRGGGVCFQVTGEELRQVSAFPLERPEHVSCPGNSTSYMQGGSEEDR